MTPVLTRVRLGSIDRLRGAVMALMLVDHVREFFFLQHQVSDPMSLDGTSVALFFTRLSSHVCAPIFVLLTGLSAWLYGQKLGRSRNDTTRYLAQRGLILIVLELTVVSFAWSFELRPSRLYLQVIWAIGLSMLALAALLWLPRVWQITLAAGILCGHNLLDGVHFTPDQWGFVPWGILHDRSLIRLGDGLTVRTSYPVLPWIGLILAGYLLGPWYAPSVEPAQRQRRLLALGLGALLGFAVLRGLHLYGDQPWVAGPTEIHTFMAFLNVTKYPPSLHFILLTVGLGLLALVGLERLRDGQPLGQMLGQIGAVPMFFYLAHLYLLHLLYLVLKLVFGPNQGERYGFDGTGLIWLTAGVVLLALIPLCQRLARMKQTSTAPWLSYF
ncbi:heparan-alpha-glucosaminide N-acetyltransferase domain-containing protein [Curvibacter sp. RS43]|nr:heparan-alpha-glucosaminide N-acetyltransferase domain-containing protein [Curvibacter sp. RS43]